MRFLLKAGDHEQWGRVYKKGDTVTTDLDLVAMFGAKFERVYEVMSDLAPAVRPDIAPVAAPAAPLALDAGDSDSDATGDADAAPVNPLGEDVTQVYPAAEAEGLVVLYQGSTKLFHIAAKANPTIALNPEGLRKKDVKSFIATYDA